MAGRLDSCGAPSTAYLTGLETGCGLICDSKSPCAAAQLRKLYGSNGGYRKKFEAAKAEAITQGYLLPADARAWSRWPG